MEWLEDSAVTVVLAADGYPNHPKTGDEISNLNQFEGVTIFQAGTKFDEKLISSGGRVLSVTGVGNDLTQARDRAYRSISQIKLAGSFYRNDIALNASIAEKGN